MMEMAQGGRRDMQSEAEEAVVREEVEVITVMLLL